MAAKSCHTVDLSHNLLGKETAKSLCVAMNKGQLPHLRSVDISCNEM